MQNPTVNQRIVFPPKKTFKKNGEKFVQSVKKLYLCIAFEKERVFLSGA